MANRMKGQAVLQLDGGERYTLVLDHEAILQASAAYGKSIAAMFEDVQPRGGAEASDDAPTPQMMLAMRSLLYGTMQAHHPHVTVRDASAITMQHTAAVGAALTEAVQLAFPDPADATGDRDTGNVAAASRTSKGSGASGAKRGSTRKRSGG